MRIIYIIAIITICSCKIENNDINYDKIEIYNLVFNELKKDYYKALPVPKNNRFLIDSTTIADFQNQLDKLLTADTSKIFISLFNHSKTNSEIGEIKFMAEYFGLYNQLIDNEKFDDSIKYLKLIKNKGNQQLIFIESKESFDKFTKNLHAPKCISISNIKMIKDKAILTGANLRGTKVFFMRKKSNNWRIEGFEHLN